MNYNIELIKTQEMFCRESAAASVARWKNKNYEMMYLNVLGFQFDYQGASNDVNKQIGPYISAGYSDEDMFEPLKKYHGVEVLRHERLISQCTAEELLEEIKSNIPVGVSYRHPYCDWSKQKDKTYLLITGYDDESLHCLDVHASDPETKRLSVQNFKRYFVEQKKVRYETYKILPYEVKNVTMNEFIEELNQSEYVKKNTLENMMQFADFMEANLDFITEEKGYDNWYFIPLFLNITHILRARRLLSKTLDYIYSLTHDDIAFGASIEFSELSAKWKVNWALLQKLEVTRYQKDNPRFQKMISQFAQNIRELAMYENNFVTQLRTNQYHPNIRIRAEKTFSQINSQSQIEEIDISRFYNNCAFASSESNEQNADISGMHEFFVLEKNSDKVIYLLGSQEKTRLINYGNMDNVSCNNQIIEIQPIECRRLIVVGCSEWKDGNDQLKVVLADNLTKDIIIDIMDWYHYRNNPNCVWSGNAVDFKGDCVKRGLYGFEYELQEKCMIKKIILPNDRHIHIFNIYAIKE